MRRTGHRQLGLVFADNPQGGGNGRGSDASDQRSWLLHTAKHKIAASPATRVAEPDRLLEEVASEANLARALLNVVRNKGAPGVDGQTVEEAEAQAPRLLAVLRRDLLAERFRPGGHPPGLDSQTRRRPARTGHSERDDQGGSTGHAPGPGADL